MKVESSQFTEHPQQAGITTKVDIL